MRKFTLFLLLSVIVMFAWSGNYNNSPLLKTTVNTSSTTEDYCTGEAQGGSGSIDGFITTNGFQNIDNQDTGGENGYENYTDMVVSQSAGQTIDFSVLYNGALGPGVAIFIDYDQDFEFQDSEKVFTTGSWANSSPVTGTITIPEGTADGNYRLRVVSDYILGDPEACQNGNFGEIEDYTLTVVGSSDCPAIDAFVENFDTTDEGEIPDCFQTLMVNSANDNSDMKVHPLPDAISSPNVFRFYNADDTSVEMYLITPELNNLADADHRLRFYFDGSGSGNVNLEVGTMSDATDGSTFTSVEAIPDIPFFEEYIVNFDESSTDTYVAFKVSYSADYYSVFLDDVNWEPIPACLNPEDLTLDYVDLNTADLSWTAGGNETEWEVVYGEPGFDPESEGESEIVNESPNITLTDLSLNTEYEVYVKALCADGDSEYASPITFFTSCEATTIPFTQDFEGVTIPELPNCGTLENVGNGNNWETYNETSYGFNSNVLRYEYSIYDPADVWYFTQGIELEAGINYQITYTYGNNSTYNSEKLKVSYGTDATASAMDIELADHPEIEGAEATTNTVYFTATSDDTYYFGFHAYSDAIQYYLYVDDIEIDFGPTCPEVNNIEFDYLTDNSAKVMWTAGGNDTAWEVIYGEAGFNPDNEGELVNVDNGLPETTLTDLEPETEYEVYVRAICGEQDESILAGPESFTTLVTPPENTRLCDAILLMANDGCADGPYTNEDAFSEVDEPGGSCLNNFQGANTVWFSFVAPSDGEATITTDFPSTEFFTETVVFEAPEDCEEMNTLGDEVGCANNGADVELSGLNPGDMYYVKIGGFEDAEGDFCIEVQTEAESPCLAPTDIIVDADNITDSSADISWTANGSETQWEVVYGEEGFNPEADGELILVNDIPETTLDDLEEDTAYDVYVRAICSEDDTSDWTGPVTFNTYLDVDNQIFENFTYYPNPVKDQLTLKAGTQIESVIVYNLLGQMVMTENPNNLEMQLNTEGLQSGVYLMKVNLNGSEKAFRIVKR